MNLKLKHFCTITLILLTPYTMAKVDQKQNEIDTLTQKKGPLKFSGNLEEAYDQDQKIPRDFTANRWMPYFKGTQAEADLKEFQSTKGLSIVGYAMGVLGFILCAANLKTVKDDHTTITIYNDGTSSTSDSHQEMTPVSTFSLIASIAGFGMGYYFQKSSKEQLEYAVSKYKDETRPQSTSQFAGQMIVTQKSALNKIDTNAIHEFKILDTLFKANLKSLEKPFLPYKNLDSNLNGKLVLKFNLDSSGKIQNLSYKKESIQNDSMIFAVLNQLILWKSPIHPNQDLHVESELCLNHNSPPQVCARSKENIMNYVKFQTSKMRYLYNQTLKRNPSAQGVITTQFTILPNGQIENLNLKSSTLDDSQFVNEVLQNVNQWQFESIPGQNPTPVTIPFTFSDSF